MKRAVAALQPLWQTVMALGILVIVLDLLGVIAPPGGVVWAAVVVGVLVVAAVLMSTAPRADSAEPVQVAAPVTGTWLAVNSPGQKLPSHGTATLGQLSAVDLIQPDDHHADQTSPPAVRWGWRGSRPEQFRCFGAPIAAMAAGVVVEVSDIQPDQRARNTWQALIWFSTGENILRALAGWRLVIGNRVVIDHEDGTYSAYAHLKRGSAVVSVGERVQPGQPIAAVGNTGNTTQPHLHVQLMDRARFHAAAGLPMTWSAITLGPVDPDWQQHAQEPAGTALAFMPRNGQTFSA